MTDRIQALRGAPLDPGNVDPDPLAQFRRWYGEAAEAGQLQPDAMHFATVDEAGRPSGRMVLYKDPQEFRLGVAGFPFFTHTESPKARDLAGNDGAALTFHWTVLGRQVRVRGEVRRLPDEAADRYFAGRPEGSKLGAWASPQSQPIESREALMARVEEVRRRFEGKPVPRPPHWGGYWLDPHEVEFWQHRDDRLHDRVLYALGAGGKWARRRLAP